MKTSARLLSLAALFATSAFAEDKRSLQGRADAAYKAKDFAACARTYEEMLRAEPTKEDLYNAACCLALDKQADKAFAALNQSLQLGTRSFDAFRDNLLGDGDLASLREDPRWKELIASVDRRQVEYVASINGERYHLYEEDQADRKGTFDREKVWPRDRKRMDRVLEMLNAGQIKAADDFYHAGLILQHGKEPADFALAFSLASESARLDPSNRAAGWLRAATKDRFLWSVGRPQIYATQSKKVDGKWTVEPIDEKAITEEERDRIGVMRLAATRRRLEEQNQAKPTPAQTPRP